MTGFQMIAVDDFVRRHDARPIDDNTQMELEDSVGRLGLLNPLTVRAISGGRFEIIAGSHRFAACQLVGLQEIACQVLDLDDTRAELAMIDENLTRHQVEGILLEQQLARRKAIYIELNPQTAHGAVGNGREKSRQVGDSSSADRFTADTAAMTGKSERTIQRAVERGDKITPEAAALVQGSPLDVGTYRQALKDVPAEEQVAKVQQDLAAPPRRQPPAAPPPKPKPAPGEAFTRFIELAIDMGKIAPKDIVAGLPDPSRRADLRNHVRSLLDRLEAVDQILEGGSNA